MKLLVKTLVFITALSIYDHPVFAQLKIATDNGLVADIKKVIEDHPYHFSHITGELILENPQSSDYQCSLKVSGAEESTITRYSAKNKDVYSWQALMLTTESFDDAKKKFKALYSQLNEMKLKTSRLSGVYEAPVEEKKFSTVIFSFDGKDEAISKLKVELVIFSEILEWKVRLVVYDREREDNERGRVVE